MNTPATFLKTHCHKCRGPIEFPAEGTGERIPCPHCGAEVTLTTATRAPDKILIQPKATPIRVKESTLALVLQVIGFLQLIASPVAALMAENGGWIVFAVMASGGVATLAFAKLIESTHETAQRLARLELFFQTVVNERK